MESTSLGMPHLELVGLEVKAKPEVPPLSCVTAEAMAGGLQGHISSSRCPQRLCRAAWSTFGHTQAEQLCHGVTQFLHCLDTVSCVQVAAGTAELVRGHLHLGCDGMGIVV